MWGVHVKRILGALFFVGLLTTGLIICEHINRVSCIGVFSTALARHSVVVLDAGHGGIDGGATVNGIKESEINLQITQKLRTFLRLMGYQVVMTREGDYSIHDNGASSIRAKKRTDLKNRLSLMQKTPGAICVSIHLNRFAQSSVHGAQVFFGPCDGSESLARIIQESIAAHLQTDNDRVIKKADSSLYILRQNESNPAVMVECGFLSNPGDASNLQNDEYQNRLAVILGCAILQYDSENTEKEIW